MSEPSPSSAPDTEIVDVWAPWCGPCRAMAPAFDRLAAEFEGRVRLTRINADEAPQEVERLAVLGLPTLIVRRGGAEVTRHTGGLGEAALRRLFTEAAAGADVTRPRPSLADVWLRLAVGGAFAAIGLTPPTKVPAALIGAFFLGWGGLSLVRRLRGADKAG